MMKHDEKVFCIQKIYPQTTHGVDYWVGHPCDHNGGQIGPACIVQWNLDKPQPSDEAIQEQWDKYGKEYAEIEAADKVRAQRNALLIQADYMVESEMDAGNKPGEKAARAYRKALRDLPKQPGFPFEIQWPQRQVEKE